jgi:hypothetical protein
MCQHIQDMCQNTFCVSVCCTCPSTQKHMWACIMYLDSSISITSISLGLLGSTGTGGAGTCLHRACLAAKDKQSNIMGAYSSCGESESSSSSGESERSSCSKSDASCRKTSLVSLLLELGLKMLGIVTGVSLCVNTCVRTHHSTLFKHHCLGYLWRESFDLDQVIPKWLT